MRKITLLICGLCLACAACSPKCDCEMLNREIALLKQTLDRQHQELDAYRNDPKKMLTQAEDYYKRRDLAALKAMYATINTYHPEAAETKKVGSWVERLNKQKQDSIAKAEAERLTVVKRLKKKYDDVSGNTWYYQPYFIHYNNENLASIYMGQNSEQVWLRLKMSYGGSDWIFFENAYLSYDGNTYEVDFDNYREKESENSGGRVWEWIDVPVSNTMLSYLENFVQAKSPKMRLSGKYTTTRNLSYSEIKGMKDVLMAYRVLQSEKK